MSAIPAQNRHRRSRWCEAIVPVIAVERPKSTETKFIPISRSADAADKEIGCNSDCTGVAPRGQLIWRRRARSSLAAIDSDFTEAA
jgi:hypothetical protein